jgi:hypothetical protein
MSDPANATRVRAWAGFASAQAFTAEALVLQSVGVVLAAPSVLPAFNPSFRVFRYNRSSGLLLGYTQYYAGTRSARPRATI